jgi:hypothetical protein
MACNACESMFQGARSLVVSITKSGTSALLYLNNQGRNILLVRRILLCQTSGSGYSTLYLRPPPDQISWTYPSAYLEPGITALYYSWAGVPAGAIVQAQAEYIEIEGRSISCPTNF